MTTARKIAMRALVKVNRDGGYSNLVLKEELKESGLDKRDESLATALFYGVLERKITLDHIIAKYSKMPPHALSPAVIETLRLGLYQLLYMDKIPDMAAVNESVNLIKSTRQRSASGLVNAILRAFIRDDKQIDFPEEKIKATSIRYSCPEWLIESFMNDYGEAHTKSLLAGFFGAAPVSIRVNTLKISPDELIAKLTDEGITAEKHPLGPNILTLKSAVSIETLCGYREGLFHVQGASSALAADALGASASDRVFDVCAAPGGKTFSIAENMKDIGEIVSADLHTHRVGLIEEGKKRLGLGSVKPVCNDASVFNPLLGQFDKILCDSPCSGLGTIKKKPEIRYKDVAFLDNLDELQYNLLHICSKYLKVGGRLIYSTCTLRHKENRDIVSRFLSEHASFAPAPIYPDTERAIDEPSHMLTLMPHVHHTDGFFIAAFTKTR